MDQRGRERERQADHRDGEDQRQPDAVDALLDRGPLVTGADPAGDGGGGRVGEEDEDVDQGGEHRGGDAEPRELRCAQVSDDRGVGHQEERFGDQGAERGDREG